MSDHLKRLNAPDSVAHTKDRTPFHYEDCTQGAHNANAMPIAVWLRDVMGFARNMKEVEQILNQNDVVVNGRPSQGPEDGHWDL